MGIFERGGGAFLLLCPNVLIVHSFHGSETVVNLQERGYWIFGRDVAGSPQSADIEFFLLCLFLFLPQFSHCEDQAFEMADPCVNSCVELVQELWIGHS